MGKKRETSTEEESFMESPGGTHKKHKKHKKHKHKKHKDRSSEDVEVNVEDLEETPKPAIKLKIKIGGETFEAKSVNKAGPDVQGAAGENHLWEGSQGGIEPVLNVKKPGDDTSDEEREWLEALEAGTLDDYGEIKKQKDPTLLTARQRALLHGNKAESLLELPSGYKAPELTEEQLQRRQQRAKKRREQAQQKQEKDKKQTLDRLLKKQEAKAGKQQGKYSRKSLLPGLRYLNKPDRVTISIPQGFDFPLPPQQQQRPPLARACGVYGCKNLKKYSCSKTGVPICSLECYKKNLSLRGLTTPQPAVKT